MANDSIGTVRRPEANLIHNTAASTVTLTTANTPVKLTDGAALGELEIRTASTHGLAGAPLAYSNTLGEYTVQNHGRILADVELRAAKGVAGSVVTFRLVLGKAGDAAGVGTVVFARQIPASAGTAQYYIRAHEMIFGAAPGQVLTAQVVSDTNADSLAIADCGILYKSIPEVLGSQI